MSVRRDAFLFAFLVIAATSVPAVVAADVPPAGAGLNACTLLTDDEIRRIGGAAAQDWMFGIARNYSPLAGGGSECEVPLFGIQLDAAPVSQYAARIKAYEDGTTFEPIAGIGDEARYYVQRGDTVGVYARTARHMFVVSCGVPMGATADSRRQLVIEAAKVIAQKLK